MDKIQHVQSPIEISICFEVLNALRPTLTPENIVPIISGMMKRGYHLLYVLEDGKAVCAAGYRFTEHLHWGKAIYVDDLSTLPGSRKKGNASRILDEIFKIAKDHNCNEVHLDSGCGANRYDAHRFYLQKGFNITSHHFAIKVH